MIELIRFEFTTRLHGILGLAAERLDFFARLAQSVPVRRLSYPAGHERFPDVHKAILADLKQI